MYLTNLQHMKQLMAYTFVENNVLTSINVDDQAAEMAKGGQKSKDGDIQ